VLIPEGAPARLPGYDTTFRLPLFLIVALEAISTGRACDGHSSYWSSLTILLLRSTMVYCFMSTNSSPELRDRTFPRLFFKEPTAYPPSLFLCCNSGPKHVTSFL